MFSRNALKELTIALELTKKLEDALIKDGAKGNSLSDKIKSYQEYDEAEYIEEFKDVYLLDGEECDEETTRNLEYEFRNYKRSLLGGLYNDLRWVAHERNQLMHHVDYQINDFGKFQSTIKKAIFYFKHQKVPLSFVEILLSLIVGFVFLLMLYWLWHFVEYPVSHYFSNLMIDLKNADWFGVLIKLFFAFVVLGLIIQLIRTSIILITIVWHIVIFIIIVIVLLLAFVFRYWWFTLLLFLSYLLWDKDMNFMINIYKNLVENWNFKIVTINDIKELYKCIMLHYQ